ncbi:MAG: SPOR domain-containing protein [Deltaproteobacteria bacterium]|nr:SPOR domain-containing protein [Deltaproteobacteria bacterium]MCL5277710.1 SPOR domain-containing protein [Deltaproteobacteria bacterium]
MEDKKGKDTKKTIADELFEDNFFKPPIDEVIEKAGPDKPEAAEKPKGPEEKESSLLFDEFLKSPLEAAPEANPELTLKETPLPVSAPAQDGKPPVTASRPAIVIKTVEEPSGSRKGILVGALIGGASVIVLAVGYIYFTHTSSSAQHAADMTGSQTIVIKHEAPVSQPPPAEQRHAVPVPAAAPPSGNKPAMQEQTGRQPVQQVATNVPPAPKPIPVQAVRTVSKQFEVRLEAIKTKAALENARRIGLTMDRSLNFDVKENTKNSATYSLVVDKVYPSEGEATADNLKLMVANVSNASIVKADGGYRILVGKYRSKASADSDRKNIEAAGLKGLIKENVTKVSTYNVRVFPFKSSGEAHAYLSRVKRLAAKAISSEIK